MASFLLGAPSLIEQDYLLAEDVGMAAPNTAYTSPTIGVRRKS